MQKVIVIGCPGAGKSSFARALRDAVNLPLYHLDLIWHKSDGTNVTREEFDARLDEIIRTDSWILDGNYQRTLEMRLNACDTVFLLEYPLEVCLAGAEARVGTKRDDMPWVETGFDPEFRQCILDFPEKQLPEIHVLLEKYRENRTVFVFRSRAEAEMFLKTFGAQRKNT